MIVDPYNEALSGMASTGSPRIPMGRDAIAGLIDLQAVNTSEGELNARYANPSNDPALFPTARPKNVMQERGGARHGIRVNIPLPAMPEAAPTQANGRVIRNRGGAGPSFWGGAAV